MSPTQTKRIAVGFAAIAALSLAGCHQNEAGSAVPTVAEQQQENAKEKAQEDSRLTPDQKAAAAKAQAAENADNKPEH